QVGNKIPCTVDGLDLSGTIIDTRSGVENAEACQTLCRENTNCEAGIFKADKSCILKNEIMGLPVVKTGFALAMRSCHQQPCSIPNTDIEGLELHVLSTDTEKDCQLKCGNESMCLASVFDREKKQCHLKYGTKNAPSGTNTVVTFKYCDCPSITDPDNRKMVCTDPKLRVGSHCALLCPERFDGSELAQVTCQFHNDNQSYHWSGDLSLMSCPELVGIVVGGKDRTSTYLKSVEVFSNDEDQCQAKKLPDYPFDVAGPVSGSVDGFGIVCGGATNSYVECTNRKGGGKVCDRNVEYVETKGGSRWYDGPKTTQCHYYDHELTHTWLRTVDLKEARAYASSAPLPTGELWILGGLGSKSILDSTEIVGRNPITTAWYVKPGLQRLPRALFGHCSVQLDQNRIAVIGGFWDGDYSAQVHTYNIKNKAWALEATSLNEARNDHVCKLTRVRGVMQVLATGGWNKNGALNTTELMDVQTRIWTLQGKFDKLPDFEDNLETFPSLRRSAVLFGGSSSVMMVGGVTCGLDNDLRRNCTQMSSSIKFTPHESDPSLDKWEKMSSLKMSTPRSSHTLFHLPKAFVCNNR
ncbi:hypothetical protein TCAL_11396, partial [Tigriopus californicus]